MTLSKMALITMAYSIMILSIMSLSIMTISMTTLCHYAECSFAECRVLDIAALNVIMLIVVMLSAAAPITLISLLLIAQWSEQSSSYPKVKSLNLEKMAKILINHFMHITVDEYGVSIDKIAPKNKFIIPSLTFADLLFLQ
jgi:hypothetical protein